jgi:hypothetical protein
MVIQDRQTRSVWQHATGEAIAGPLKGEQLALIGGNLVRWSAWQAAHPDGVLATEPDPPAPNLMSIEGMVRLFRVTERAAGPGLAAAGDDRLPLHEIIIGIEHQGAARAYPLAVVRHLRTIRDELGGEKVELHYDAAGDSVEVTINGQTVTPSRQWWLGWSEFFPHTDVFEAEN